MGCIIITACTDKNSPEVEIAREYRDKFLTHDQLKGYYWLAEKVVPKINNSDRLKRFTKKHLVDNLIEYGKYTLGKSSNKPDIMARIVTRVFLAICGMVGRQMESFQRANGEVV